MQHFSLQVQRFCYERCRHRFSIQILYSSSTSLPQSSFIMSVEDLKTAARKYIEEITTIHPTLALPRAFLSENVRSISLVSLVEKLNVSTSVKSIFQVGILTSQNFPSDLARNDRFYNSHLKIWSFWAYISLKSMTVNTTRQTKMQQSFFANGYQMLFYPLEPLQKPRHIQRVSLFRCYDGQRLI